jgi:glycosyltransferase involved in cell wall biosynthesis
MNVALLHFSAPPIIGGVEHTLARQAVGLSELGHQVTVLAGAGDPFDPRVTVHRLPLAYSRHPRILEAKQSLDRGEVPPGFGGLVEEISRGLGPMLAGQDALIAHNILCLHLNLALTSALHSLHAAGKVRHLIGWHHDLAWDRPDLQAEVHAGTPADLLREPWPAVVNVAVSEATRQRLAALYGCPPETIHVIPAGVAVPDFEGWTEEAVQIFRANELSAADAILLQPVRITRRKNFELALRVLRDLRRLSGRDVRLLVTGPMGAHNPDNLTYFHELTQLRRGLGLDGCAHFVAPESGVAEATLICFYRAADALLLTSLEEGFGMPVLEAALTRLPVFSTDLPALAETGGEEIHWFSPDEAPAEIARRIAAELFSDRAYRLRRRVRRRYAWDAVIRDRLAPLLAG